MGWNSDSGTHQCGIDIQFSTLIYSGKMRLMKQIKVLNTCRSYSVCRYTSTQQRTTKIQTYFFEWLIESVAFWTATKLIMHQVE